MERRSKIHRNHNVYILGAGFSRGAHLPLVWDFMNYMRDSIDWLLERGRTEEVHAIDEVFDLRLKSAGAAYRSEINLENIEDFFSLVSARESDAPLSKITKAIAATIDFALGSREESRQNILIQRGTLDPARSWITHDNSTDYPHHTMFEVPLYDLYVGLLSGLFCATADARNTVITFNYDTLVEKSLESLSVPFHYAIPDGMAETSGTFPTELYSPDGMPVLKLHGSVNWGMRQGRDSVSLYQDYAALREAGDDVLIIPPTWRKSFAGVITKVWEKALVAIEEATRIIIIGFSIPSTDVHFKYLLAAGLKDNVSLRKLFFVNPCEQQIEQDNLFKVVRESLRKEGIVKLVPSKTHEFLVDKANLAMIGRGDIRYLERDTLPGITLHSYD